MSERIKPLSPAGSLLLDVVRLLAALTVAFGHLTEPMFSLGWPDYTRPARGAVTVFFILSGFVIRHVTLSKPVTLTRYGIDRASRIYSVALPALMFTYGADWISHSVNPSFYNPLFGGFYNHFFARAAANILFLAILWKRNVFLLSNGPFWSLCYECFYYALYGVGCYLAGARRVVLIVLGCLLVGPPILIFLPLWLLGCGLHAMYQKTRGSALAIAVLGGALVSASALWIALPALRRSVATFTYSTMESHYSYGNSLGSQFVIVGPVFLVLLFGMLLVEGWNIDMKSRASRAIRIAAEATFPLYLFHFPLFVLIRSVTNYSRNNSAIKALILVFALCLSIVLGTLFNRLKFRLRDWMTALLPNAKSFHPRPPTTPSRMGTHPQ